MVGDIRRTWAHKCCVCVSYRACVPTCFIWTTLTYHPVRHFWSVKDFSWVTKYSANLEISIVISDWKSTCLITNVFSYIYVGEVPCVGRPRCMDQKLMAVAGLPVVWCAMYLGFLSWIVLFCGHVLWNSLGLCMILELGLCDVGLPTCVHY